MIIVDFNINLILEFGFILFSSQKMYRLVTSNELATVNYIKRVETLFHHHKIQDKLYTLESDWNLLSSTKRQIKLNHIDQMAMELLLNTERKCHKLHTGTIQFNPVLSKLGLH